MQMRKLMATILAICLGILLPAAAMPVRVCLLDPAKQLEDCCGTSTNCSEPCCADVDILPDATMPGGNFAPPTFVGFAIPFVMVQPSGVVGHIPPRQWPMPPRTGTGPPTARLAVLNVWRL